MANYSPSCTFSFVCLCSSRTSYVAKCVANGKRLFCYSILVTIAQSLYTATKGTQL